ncbi:MAG TPA: 4Fe-4S dicluster domain-containing protein [candidate division Zixibacteria bacterium]|nr:4Fe-4S dicluster domain-containing protein [candidate division Zixibacteria bacterium]
MPLNISQRTTSEALRKKIVEISGQDIGKCYQCGTCSGSCPMIAHINCFPRKLMALAQLGHIEGLAEANTPWVCASCHACMVRCPRGIDIPKVMEAIRLLKLRQNVNEIEPSNLQPEEIIDLPQIAMVSGFRKLTS